MRLHDRVDDGTLGVSALVADRAAMLVTVVLDALAAGLNAPEIVEHYPTIDDDGVRAAAAYGA